VSRISENAPERGQGFVLGVQTQVGVPVFYTLTCSRPRRAKASDTLLFICVKIVTMATHARSQVCYKVSAPLCCAQRFKASAVNAEWRRQQRLRRKHQGVHEHMRAPQPRSPPATHTHTSTHRRSHSHKHWHTSPPFPSLRTCRHKYTHVQAHTSPSPPPSSHSPLLPPPIAPTPSPPLPFPLNLPAKA